VKLFLLIAVVIFVSCKTHTANGQENHSPVVDAGADQRVTGRAAQLAGIVSDDEHPDCSVLTSGWNVVRRPDGAEIAFSDTHDPQARVIFSDFGLYTLQLTGYDTEKSAHDLVNIAVERFELPEPPPTEPPPGETPAMCPIGHENQNGRCVELDATFYVDNVRGLDVNEGTKNAPWQTLAHAFATMQGGDTLVLSDNVYTESMQGIPSGGNGNYTVIQAEKNYETVIDGDGLSDSALIVENGKHHIHIQGIHFKGAENSGTGGPVAMIGEFREDSNTRPTDGTAFITLYRNLFQGGSMAEGNQYSHNVSVSVSNNILMEENATFGKANKYHFQTFRSDSVIIRRNLVRWDAVNPDSQGSGQPAASFTFYDTANSIFENNLALDGLHSSTTTTASFYIPAHYIGCDNNKFLGNIALNNMSSTGIEIDPGANQSENGDSWTCGNHLIRNNVSWNNKNGEGIGINIGQSDIGAGFLFDVTIDRNTIGRHKNGGRGVNIHHDPKDIFFINNIIDSASKVANNSDSTLNLSYTIYNDFSEFVSGNGTNNLDNNTNVDPELNVIVKIEDGSPGKGAGMGGVDVGATVLKRYHNGELIDEDLWPWPNEAILKQKMCTDVGETRGFCAFPSITDYIWQPI
jgi:hypothetical protein